ncbi:MAG: cytochrome oxidase subunit [Mycobacterium sp.]|jgi:nitric oxide reductase NorE protein|nr:cytochrome oxidase subunit [Mycobacterium sp.]
MSNTERSAAALDDAAAAASGDGAKKGGVHLPGDVNMWVFVLGDLIIFGAYFIIFMIYRTQQRSVFLESQQHLSLDIGVVNTLLLLASSWFVARGVVAARADDHGRAVRRIVFGSGCGLLFIVVKGYEWSSEIRQGLTFPRNDFFMFYYLLTGVHLFHVVLGLVILAIVVLQLRNGKHRRVFMAETGATYWHMVDLLWIVIFALLYVMR